MSTIDEVLAAAEVVDAVCVIDGETRIISVPAEYKELGVESDEKVTRVKFQCPKVVGDNIDLTEYNLYINYRNADNKLNSYLVEDVTVTGDTISFSWLLSRHVTESPGTISYIVCAKKSDYTGVINEWNTKVATGIVGIGLEATEEIEEQNIDAIEQILRSIVELENKVDSGGSGGSGEAGGYYAPAVDADGNLSWTASKADMPAVDGANIKGPQGDTGAKGDTGSKGDKGEKGADGKSAYQYAVEGGYTGTEAEFAAKLAAEKLPNPNALTFTGAVTGSYDGSAPLSVEIPSGGGSGGSGGGEWQTILTGETTVEAVTTVTIPMMASDFDEYRAVIVIDKNTDGTTTNNNTNIWIDGYLCAYYMLGVDYGKYNGTFSISVEPIPETRLLESNGTYASCAKKSTVDSWMNSPLSNGSSGTKGILCRSTSPTGMLRIQFGTAYSGTIRHEVMAR